ncbi:cysteine hydrolase family protein [Terrarubrum flagellatum]|uniref:cysteine hydrolase family protein n=1 Tax=Terrirubrum flagellatum TaxID=2895980 RepID=UPI003144D721
MAVWEQFLTEDDRKVLAKRKARAKNDLGAKPALLLVDMQMTACGYDKPIYEQLEEYSGACGPHAWKAITVQRKLLAAARQAGMPVIYSKHLFKPEMGLAKAGADSNFSSLNAKSEVPAEVAMQQGDILVEKQTPSCFAYTNLPLILNEKGIDSLLVGGNSTSGCVRATCVDAAGFGIKVQVIEEATFDRIEFSHAAALFDMQFKYCDVISADEALAAISKFGPKPAMAAE